MNNQKDNKPDGLFKGVFLAYTVLLLHLLLVAGLGFLVFFFRGIIQYMGWILAGGLMTTAASGYYFYRKMRREGKNLKEMIHMPLLAGRTVEVSLLGGLASFRVGQTSEPGALIEHGQSAHPLLEDPGTLHIRELKELVRLFEDGLITQDEYNRAKQKLFNF
jgi:hypothetical protein